MDYKEKFTDGEWEKLALMLSGEEERKSELFMQFSGNDKTGTVKSWDELRSAGDSGEIDIEKAWDKVSNNLGINESAATHMAVKKGFSISTLLRVAAVGLILFSLGFAGLYLNNNGLLSRRITVATNSYQQNQKVDLPDGSMIYLNRNTRLSYRSDFGKKTREVKLKGEAFFDVAPDISNPFSIDAGKARVIVVGTSFNVITNNNESAVEVYVKTGKVELSDSSGTKSMFLEPEFIGTMSLEVYNKTVNSNQNYLSWNTGLLIYDGQKLEAVLSDLKRVYNMEIMADDPSILENPWKATIDNQTPETIINLICASFNLGFSKDGTVYHLVKR